MGWFGFGKGNEESGSPGMPPSAAVVQLEQQIEMMDMVFMKSIKQCGRKCIPANYKDGELYKGEVVCIQRCLSKFFEVLETVSGQLAEVGMQAQASIPK